MCSVKTVRLYQNMLRYILKIYTYFILYIWLVQKIEYTDVKKMYEMDNFERRNHSLIPYRGKIFSLLQCVLSSSRAHPATYAMGNGGILPGRAAAGFDADQALHLVLRLGINGAITPLPHMSSQHAQGQLSLYLCL